MNYIRETIAKHLLEYLDIKEIQVTKVGKIAKIVDCIKCKAEGAANILPNVYTINCHSCNETYDLIDVVAMLEPETPRTEEETLNYLKDLLKVAVTTESEVTYIDRLLAFYKDSGFNLVQLVRGKKNPIPENWTKTVNRNILDWREWIDSNLNIGVITGASSNITILDVDILTKQEKEEYRGGTLTAERKVILDKKVDDGIVKAKELVGDIGTPLVQRTIGGVHWIYQYENALPKTSVKLEDIHIDVENDGGQVVIEPSKIGTAQSIRKMVEWIKPTKMPENLKAFLLDKIVIPKTTYSEEVRTAIEDANFKIDAKDFMLKDNGLDGCCNSSFIKLGGVFRKQFSSKQVETILRVLNKHMLERPMEYKEISSMMRELEKYSYNDEEALAEKVLQYLFTVKEATTNEIVRALDEKKIRIDNALAWLREEEYVAKPGRIWIPIEKVEWTTKFADKGQRLEYNVPYLQDLAVFRSGDMVVISAPSGAGKTHLSMNMVKKIVDQKIVPDYIGTESGSRWAKIAQQLGMKEGDFRVPKKKVDPALIELEDNAITIIDWLLPKDYAKTDQMFARLNEQLDKHGGLLIVFMQMRKDGSLFAANLVEFFPSLVCKFMYEDEDDREHSYIETIKIRESRNGRQHIKIPCKYNNETKELLTIEEIEKREKEKKDDKTS